MKQTLLLLLSLAFTALLFAQSNISGTVNDTINKQKLENSSVVLMRAKDSVLYKFTRSNAQGNFSFNKADTGKYILLITQNSYADYVDNIVIKDSASSLNLGTIAMTLKANILKEVIVKQTIGAIRIKGDTTEYAADSFKVQAGASVEDLLRKLPGLQVDKDGKITAQGESVQKVLVDGEEFFGDDPTLATKNIQADAIDKVQVYDKKSDQATFTGIDDGEKTKTINLKLKADKKKGYFGKVDLASDFNNRWNNSLMINNFKNKLKVSAYGITSNTGKTGLDWGEQDKYGSGNNMEYDDDYGGFVSFSEGDDLSNGDYYGEGLPKSWAAGANLSNKWNDDKVSANGSYRYNKLNVEGTSATTTQSLLPDSNYYVNKENASMYSSRERHSANGTLDWQFDSSTSAKVVASGYTGTSLSRSFYNSSYANSAGIAVNNSNRISTSDGSNQNLNVNAIFRKKFKKIGRTLSVNINEIYKKTNSTGLLKADLVFNNAKTGTFEKDSVVNQQKINDNSINTFNIKATYTEPITTKLFAEINYAIRTSSSSSKRLSYDSTEDGKYEALNALYSNNYQFNVLTNTTGLTFRYNTKKLMASIGSNVGFTDFYQKDLIFDTNYNRHYTNLYPKAQFNYKFSSNFSMNLSYNGNTNQPSITQLQPVRDNTDPLSEYLGNSGLKQEFVHSLRLNINKYNAFKQSFTYFNAYFSTTTHAIVSDQFTDTATLKTTYRYVNSNGNFNYYGYGGTSQHIKKLNLDIREGVSFNGNQYSNIINGTNNTTNTLTPGIRLGLNFYKDKKFYVGYNYEYSYNFSKSTVKSSLSTNYWTQTHYLNANFTLPWKLEINTDISYNLRQKTSVFTSNNNVFLWNGYFGKHFLKNDKAIIKITANDILNQNKGFSRNINSNTIVERNYQTIKRYFMLAFTWNFSKTAAGAAAPSN